MMRTAVVTAALLFVLGCAGKDAEAPTVAVETPHDSDAVWNPMLIEIAASDNRGITRLDLEIDTSVAQTFKAAPCYFYYDNFQSESTSHVILARAWDRAGNEGVSAPVTVVATRGPRVICPVLLASGGNPLPDSVEPGELVHL